LFEKIQKENGSQLFYYHFFAPQFIFISLDQHKLDCHILESILDTMDCYKQQAKKKKKGWIRNNQEINKKEIFTLSSRRGGSKFKGPLPDLTM